MQRSPASTEVLAEQMLGFMTYLGKSTERGVFEVAGEYEMTLSQLRAVFMLWHADRSPALGELAADIGLSVAATGRLVDTLVRLGLVSRREDESDRRVKRHSLTADGEAFIARINAGRRAGVEEFIALLDDDVRDQLSHALTLLPADCGCGPNAGA